MLTGTHAVPIDACPIRRGPTPNPSNLAVATAPVAVAPAAAAATAAGTYSGGGLDRIS